MTVRTARLAGPVAITVAGAQVFLCPTDRTARILEVTACNPTGANVTVSLWIGTQTDAHLVWHARVVAGATATLDPCVLVLIEGEELRVGATAVGCSFSAHGSLLSGDPT